MTDFLKRFLFSIFCMSVMSCAHYRVNDKMVFNYNDSNSYRYYNQCERKQSQMDYTILIFSGGGTRAAALSYGVLEKLSKDHFANSGVRVLDSIDVISSVSGGSFTAAYYGLFHDQIFSDFLQSFLYRNVQRDLENYLYNPYIWYKLFSPYYGRSDLAAEYYDKILFKGKSFYDITKQHRSPYIILNATDLSQGNMFSFTQEQFDLISSNLSTYKISSAVAASSAFPILLSPITLNCYPTIDNDIYYAPDSFVSVTDNSNLNNIPTVEIAEVKRIEKYISPRRNVPFNIYPHRQLNYVHLLDGGLSDNSGAEPIYPAVHYLHSVYPGNLTSPTVRDLDIAQQISRGDVKSITFIIVDAKSEVANYDQDMNGKIPGVVSVLKTVAYGPVDAASSFSDQLMQSCMSDIAAKHCKVHCIEIGLTRIADAMVRHHCLSLPTNFNLPKSDVDLLRKVAGEELSSNPEYNSLLSDR